jgi:Domain of unknown function (DUF4365)
MAAKTVPNSVFIGNEGAYLVPQLVNEMRFLWTPSGQFELGIDGTIEVVDPATSKGTGNIIKVQIKTTSQPWAEENESGFVFPVRETDLNYWLTGNTPVILICCKAGVKEAFWISVKNYFSKLERRNERKIRFNKQRDRFDVNCREALIQLAVPKDSGLYLAPLPKREMLYSNLLPVTYFPETIFSAPTEHGTDKEAGIALRAECNDLTAEWIVTGGAIHSFHKLDALPWNKVCDATKQVSFLTSEWAYSSDPAIRRNFVRLLNRCLSQKLRGERINFNKVRDCYYFLADGENNIPVVRILKEMSLVRSATKTVVMARMSKKNPGHVSYWRHLALEPQFILLDGIWHLQITPTYLFTFDGHRLSRFAEDNLKGIKKLEKNNAVLRNVLTWANFLQPKTDWFANRYEMLKFGPLLKSEVAAGIIDQEWLNHAEDEEADALRTDLGLEQELLI